MSVLAKIAPRLRDAQQWRDLDRALARRRQLGTPGSTTPQVVAGGEGWTVADVICTSGPDDRPFEEQHSQFAIAVVVAGSFQCRSPLGAALMTPGSLMLGNSGQCFECGHAHGEGDRCVSFWYAPDHFERLSADAGVRRGAARFSVPRLPPIRALSPMVTRAVLGVSAPDEMPWDELSVMVAGTALRVSAGLSSSDRRSSPLNADARVVHALRTVDRYPASTWTLNRLANVSGLSLYHFLRTFDRITGVTPHQYVLRARLRHAAVRLVRESGSILDLALDCGFGDISNFTRAFRNEFGASPRRYRERSLRR
ncbi:MAG TPA: AraC family transcriptional regulator [Vicinamibacterales bacterium]